MAMADYAKCDRCGGKAFYDANISDPAYCATWEPSEETPAIGIAVLCATCATTHEAIIRPRDQLDHEPVDQQMLNDLLDYIIKVDAGEHGMDGAVREIARRAAAIRGPIFRSVRAAQSAKRREARRAAVTLLEIIDDGEVWRVALNAMFRVLNASDDAEHWTTVSEARSALKAALRAIAEDS